MGQDPPVITVEWQRPVNTYGELRSYKLMFGVKGDSAVQERRIDVDETRFTTGYLGKLYDKVNGLSAKSMICFLIARIGFMLYMEAHSHKVKVI